jgi:hypothetical protein
LPRVGPSPLGGVALEWDLGDVSLMLRFASSDPRCVYYQEEGPGFRQDDGVISRSEAMERLLTLVGGEAD